MRRAPRLALLALAFVAGCEQMDEETLKQTIGAAIQDNFAGIREDNKELSAANAKLAEKLDAQSAQLAALDGKLASLQAKVDELDAPARAPELPTPSPTPSPTPGRPNAASTYKVELGDAQTRGKDTALVTIVAWSDFQCPYCNRVVPTLEALESKYGSDLRLAFKHNPLAFHNRALPAAIAAEAAGEQGKFWEMHDKLFDNNKDLTDANFESWAKELGLDVKQFKKDLTSSAIKDRIEEQQKQGNTLGARGTPAFFVNGRFLSGAQPQPSFEALIDEEMTKAKALVAAGTARSDVYRETIKGGLTEP